MLNESCVNDPHATQTNRSPTLTKRDIGYIQSADKRPIEQGRWGYLHASVQKFLKTNNSKCYVSEKNTALFKRFCPIRNFNVLFLQLCFAVINSQV